MARLVALSNSLYPYNRFSVCTLTLCNAALDFMDFIFLCLMDLVNGYKVKNEKFTIISIGCHKGGIKQYFGHFVSLPKEDWTLEWKLLRDFSKSEAGRNIKMW